MSIAVSAVILPSRMLRAALALHASASVAAGVAVACGAPGPFAAPALLAACCFLAAAVAARTLAREAKTHRIDISGLGQIRLTVQQTERLANVESVFSVSLMPGSTLWPHLLLLLLRDQAGAVTVLALLPDSVAPDAFRALAVALRAVAGRNDEFLTLSKIL